MKTIKNCLLEQKINPQVQKLGQFWVYSNKNAQFITNFFVLITWVIAQHHHKLEIRSVFRFFIRPEKINCVILISWEHKVGSFGRDYFFILNFF